MVLHHGLGQWVLASENEGGQTQNCLCDLYGNLSVQGHDLWLDQCLSHLSEVDGHSLGGLQWHRCLVYLDNIIVLGKTFDETLQMVMDLLKAPGMKLKASRCQWFKRSVKYLGHVVSAEGLQCDPEKIEAVQNWPVPKTD